MNNGFFDWLLETSRSELVVRIDVMRINNTMSGNERVKAALFCTFEDDDGPVYGYVGYNGPSEPIDFRTAIKRDDWLKIIKPIVRRQWDEDWKIQTKQICRLGVLDREKTLAEKKDIYRWGRRRMGNRFVIQHLDRLLGALHQFFLTSEPQKQPYSPWARDKLLSNLLHLISQQNRDFEAMTESFDA